jgi:hypothetical protein
MNRYHSLGLVFVIALIAAGLITYQVMANSIQSVHDSLPQINHQVNSYDVLSWDNPGMHGHNPDLRGLPICSSILWSAEFSCPR